MAMSVGEASLGTGMAGEIRAAIGRVRPLAQNKEQQGAEKLAQAIAEAVIGHIVANMTLDPTGTPITAPDAVE